MNCRPGDLAVIVDSAVGHEECRGMVVHVLSLESAGRWYVTSHELLAYCKKHGYGSKPTARDSILRPIRDSDGEDEMLRIAGKPQEVNA